MELLISKNTLNAKENKDIINTNRVLIDIGSSTVKVYRSAEDKLQHLFQKSIFFKDGFNPDTGISQTNKKELLKLIEQVKKNNKDDLIKIYATGIFRKLNERKRKSLIDELFTKTGLFFNIISQDLENFYLEMALVGQCNLKEPVLLINIGGGSTELVVMKGKEVVERHNIDLGVGAINTLFPRINKKLSEVGLDATVKHVKNILPALNTQPQLSFLSGNELSYLQLAGYNLQKNAIFNDEAHPSSLSIEDFAKKNEEIFSRTPLKTLEQLMPENPKWMHGARGHSAIAQAICEQYDIVTIIPSNSNLIHGAVKQEFRNITISGSFRKHLDYILNVKNNLESKGTQVLSPRFSKPRNPGESFVIFAGEEQFSPLELERYHLQCLTQSDALVVCNPNGYVGASTFIEIGCAHTLDKRIIFTERPKEFMLQTLPAEVGL